MKIKLMALGLLACSFSAGAKDLHQMGYMSGIQLVADTFMTNCSPVSLPKELDTRSIAQRIGNYSAGVYKCHNKTDDLQATIIFDYSKAQKVNQMKEIRLEEIFVQNSAKKTLSALFSNLKAYGVSCIYQSNLNLRDTVYHGICTNDDGDKLIDFSFKTSEDKANGRLSFLQLNIL